MPGENLQLSWREAILHQMLRPKAGRNMAIVKKRGGGFNLYPQDRIFLFGLLQFNNKRLVTMAGPLLDAAGATP
jgi:hypothetical protein